MASSSAEAEYIAVSEVAGEVKGITQVLEFIGTKIEYPKTIHVDNVGSIYIANNAITRRSKHIDINYHVIREYVEDGLIKNFVCAI